MAQKHEDNSATRLAGALDQQQVDQQLLQESVLSQIPSRTAAIQQAQQPPVSNATLNAALGPGPQQFAAYGSDWKLGGQNQFHDVHTFHPSYMFNAPEVTNEYNLLNDFLSTSLLDDSAGFPSEDSQIIYADSPALNAMVANSVGRVGLQPSSSSQGQQLLGPPMSTGSSIRRPPSTAPADKEAQETYYMTAADPSGSDAPDARINKLLQAKYDAGMLRPFNYVKGYARLNKYMEQTMQASSRQKILRQLDKFRPKFRERMQSLTDVELVLVEMWFERCLMEYDRVFASMAVPACCWRRTGEIFRGNKEMAELIHVPIESLRDGKLAIHDIIVENHLVSYWEKFGAIAFDNSQKAMLTSCSLKNPEVDSGDPEISCCFSFTIRRDEHNIPSLIVGNFLPMVDPRR
ncbi:MAG: hypothetical protein MMC23_008947 [Stictis urceolatum]|nr:hypothetical protein [Stictis urceolata]